MDRRFIPIIAVSALYGLTSKNSDTCLEAGVIGAVLMGNITIDDLSALLQPSDFYDSTHKKIYRQMIEEERDGNPVDMAVLESKTGENLSAYISDASMRPEYHAKTIKQYAQRRYIGSQAPSIQKKAYDVNYNLFELVDDVQAIATHTENDLSDGNTRSAIDILNDPKSQGEQLLTGQYRLDEGLFEHNGLRRGSYTTILADSGHGKTTLMEMLAGYLLIQGYTIYWVQHENTEYTTSKHIYDFVVKNCHPDKVEKTLGRLHVSDEIHDIQAIKREARRLDKEYGLDVIFDDYIQNTENKGYGKKTDIVMSNSMEYNKLKVSLNCAVVVGSQVSIDSSQRHNWNLEPRDTDVKYSQQVKQDSDLMLSVFRPFKIDSLQAENMGDVVAKDSNGNYINKDSVFVRQVKVRGVMKYLRLHLLHKDWGLTFMNKAY